MINSLQFAEGLGYNKAKVLIWLENQLFI